MSLESAKQFINLLKEDEALQKRMADLPAEEGLALPRLLPEPAYPKGLGLDFTLEELKEAAAGKNELPVDEMEKIAGGGVPQLYDDLSDPSPAASCPKSPTGDHVWQEMAVFTEYLIIKHHVEKCAYCGATRDNVRPW